MQEAIVFVLVLLAALFLSRRLRRSWRQLRSAGKSGGCTGCCGSAGKSKQLLARHTRAS